MSPDGARKAFAVFGIVWVGGWGYSMFRYPEFFAKLRAKLGSKSSPKRIAFTRWLGLLEMIIAGVGAMIAIVHACLGEKWY